MNSIDATYMKLALRLAAKGAGWVSPNPMVGAVVVQDGRSWAGGITAARCRPTPKWRPCAVPGGGPGGRPLRDAGALQPPGPYPALHPSRVFRPGCGRVVIATRDPNPRVTGAGPSFADPGPAGGIGPPGGPGPAAE